MVLEGASIIFPNLGITIQNLSKSFTVFGFKIAWYGVIIACGMVVAVILSILFAKKTNQDADDYIDIAIWSIIFGLVGARIYYVLFSWEEYKDNLLQVFNIRAGGLAIYGGLIGGVIAAVIVCRIKKISFLRVFDTAAPAIIFAQAIGRWGNFMNMEAYGGYTDKLFAMQINYSQASGVVTEELIANIVDVDGVSYIQVHPTFLYESMWCLVVGILILIFRKYQKYNGEVLLWYIGGYALGRAWIEGLRTDQLIIGNSGIAVSQLLSIALVAGSLCLLILNRIRLATGQWVPAFNRVLEPGAPGTTEFAQAKADARKAKRAEKKDKTVDEADEPSSQDGEPDEEDEEKPSEGEPVNAPEEETEAEPDVLNADAMASEPEEEKEDSEDKIPSQGGEPDTEGEDSTLADEGQEDAVSEEETAPEQ